MGEIKRVITEQTVGACLGLFFFLMLLALFNTNAPVTAFMEAELVARSPRSVTVSVMGYKVRSCKLVSDSFVGWHKENNGAWTEASGRVSFPGDTSKNSSRPAGVFDQQNFGLFKLNGVPQAASTVRVTVNHLCGGDDVPRVTVLGPWVVGSIK